MIFQTSDIIFWESWALCGVVAVIIQAIAIPAIRKKTVKSIPINDLTVFLLSFGMISLAGMLIISAELFIKTFGRKKQSLS